MNDKGTSIAEVDNDFKGISNYTYDAIGNLISDSGEKIEKIEWTLSGKVKRVVFADKPTLEFVYDPLGNRVAKIKKPSAVPTSWEYTYYSKDASGNTMAVYERKTTVANTATPYANDNNTDILRPTEYPLYGSSRLGNYMPQFANQTSAVYTLQADNVRNYNAPYYTYNTKNTHLNERNYELTDHLGNVSATLSDYKNNKQAQILSAHVYYPFGMEMETRSLGKYRYGFNGKEKDDEGLGGGGSTYDYGFRIYNPNLARFLSVDPLTKSYPWYTPYQFAGNMPIWAIDLDGLEEQIVVLSPQMISDMKSNFKKASEGDVEAQIQILKDLVYGMNHEFVDDNGKKSDFIRMQFVKNYKVDVVGYKNTPVQAVDNSTLTDNSSFKKEGNEGYTTVYGIDVLNGDGIIELGRIKNIEVDDENNVGPQYTKLDKVLSRIRHLLETLDIYDLIKPDGLEDLGRDPKADNGPVDDYMPRSYEVDPDGDSVISRTGYGYYVKMPRNKEGYATPKGERRLDDNDPELIEFLKQ